MKKLFTLLLVIFTVSNFAYSQAPNIQWQKSMGGSAPDQGWCVIETRDGGYAISGDVKSTNGDVVGNHGDWDFFVAKLDNAGNIVWKKTLGGSLAEQLPSLVQATDGGFVIAGAATSSDGDITNHKGDYDYWVVKLDSLGNLVWEKSFGGTDYDYPHTIINTTDGGYAIIGSSGSYNGDLTNNQGSLDYWVLKIDSGGTKQWQKSYGGTGMDWGFSIVQTADKGYAASGYSDSKDGDITGSYGGNDFWMIRIDSVGKLLWEKSFGTLTGETCNSIDLTTDNGFVMGGIASNAQGNHGLDDYWVVKTDSAGNVQWQKSLGGTNYDWGRVVKGTADGGCVINGYSSSTDGMVDPSNHGGYDYWVAKLDQGGNLVWQKVLGGSGYEAGYDIIQTRDEGFAVFGSSNSSNGDVTGNHGFPDLWLVKLECAPPPATAPSITGDTLICGNLATFTVSLVPNATSYDWLLPSGATIVAGNNTSTVQVNFPPGLVSGPISVRGINKCGTGTASSVIVRVKASSAAGTVSSSEDSICELSGLTSTLATTGSTGDIIWQSSINGTSFTDIPGATSTSYETVGITQTTYYRVRTLQQGCGNDSSNSELIYILAAPHAEYSSTTVNGKVTFNSGGTTGATRFSWDFADGSSSTDENPVHIYDTSGSYYVCMTAYNSTDCSFTTCKTIVVTVGTGIDNVADISGIHIFPNPVKNQLIISFDEGVNAEKVKLFNLLGQEVKSITLKAGTTRTLTIDITELPAGIYELTLYSAGEYLNKKVVKQ